MPLGDSSHPLAPLGVLRNAPYLLTVHLRHLEIKGADELRLAQMDQNATEVGQGCPCITPVILWHPWECLEVLPST